MPEVMFPTRRVGGGATSFGVDMMPVKAATEIATVPIAAAMIFLTPRGTSPEAIPYTGVVAVAILTLAAGIARSGWLFRNSSQLYSHWLERRQGR